MEFNTLLSLVIIAISIYAAIRGFDVRAVLLAAALGLGLLNGDLKPIVRAFFGTFSNEKFVVPICSAMGFAYVLRSTQCEQHLVRLLVRPFRHVRWLMIPGIVVAGFLVNIPLISQTSTAVSMGAVVIPLMRAAGFSMTTIGSCLLLGCSVGGELLNPGAPELLTIYDATRISPVDQIQRFQARVALVQLAVAGVVYWLLTIRRDRQEIKTEPIGEIPSIDFRINPLKVLVPLVPITLLMLTGLPAPFRMFTIPMEWIVDIKIAGAEKLYGSRLIGLAMVIGVLVAMVVQPREGRGAIKHFFEGTGYGFTHIISLIVVANCFGTAISESSISRALGQLIARWPDLLQPLAIFVPTGFAALSGSGMASTQSLYGIFYEQAILHQQDPLALGSYVSIGSSAGRTMSPFAAVVLMCGTLTNTKPWELVRRVAGPLIVGLIVVWMLARMRILVPTG